jgi:hypothetical protein
MFKQTATLNANRICSVCAGKARSWFKALIFLHFISARPAAASETLLRLHDGVVAQYISKIIVTSDAWLHTFEIAIPDRPTSAQIENVALNLPRDRSRFAPISFFHGLQHEVINLAADQQCQPNATAFQNIGTLQDCAPAFPYINAVKSIWKFKNLQYIEEIHKLVHDSIPQISKADTRRKKRSFWHFFGAATVEDVQTLQQNIENLQSTTQISLQSFAHLAQKYSSFMNLSDHNIRNLAASLTRQSANTYRHLRNINAALTFLFSLTLSHSDFTDAALLIHSLEHQIGELLAGRLPRQLITPRMLADVQSNITQFLTQYGVPLHLAHQNIADLYENPQFALSRRHNKIFVTMHFPLSPTKSPLNLYRIIALKMPVDSQDQHASFITNLQSYTAYHETEDWFLEFNHLPQTSKSGLYLLQHNPTALKHRSHPTCFLAVMQLDRETIQRLCQFAIQPYAATPQILILGDRKLLMQFVSQYTLVCANETQTHQGCQICVIQVSCGCKIIAGHHQYFANIAHCHSQTAAQNTVKYAVNVNYLHQYFNTTELIADNEELLSFNPRLSIPNITFQDAQFAESFGLLTSSLFNTSSIARASLNDTQIFLDLGSALDANFQKLHLNLNKFSIRTIESILIFASPVIAILALVGLIRLHFRFQALTVAVGLIRPATARTVPPQDRVWAPNSWRTPHAIVDQPIHAYSFAPLKTLDLDTFPITAVILSILALILFLKIFKRITPLIIAGCKRIGANIVTAQSNDTFKISIAVGNEAKYISLVLMELPFAAQEYKFQAQRFLSGLRVTGFLRPVLQLTWPQLTITHKFAPLTYSMVKTIGLSYMQAHHLRNILKKPHFVLFHISREKGDSSILPLEGTAWFSDMSPEPAHSSRPNLTPPPVYPTLSQVSRL